MRGEFNVGKALGSPLFETSGPAALHYFLQRRCLTTETIGSAVGDWPLQFDAVEYHSKSFRETENQLHHLSHEVL